MSFECVCCPHLLFTLELCMRCPRTEFTCSSRDYLAWFDSRGRLLFLCLAGFHSSVEHPLLTFSIHHAGPLLLCKSLLPALAHPQGWLALLSAHCSVLTMLHSQLSLSVLLKKQVERLCCWWQQARSRSDAILGFLQASSSVGPQARAGAPAPTSQRLSASCIEVLRLD